MAIIKSGMQTAYNWNGNELNDLFYMSNGIDRMLVYDLVTVTNMGIRPPPSAATDEGTNLAGSLTVGGVYKCRFEYYNINKKRSSGFSPASANITCQSNGGIRVDIPTHTGIDAQVTHIRAYLTADGANIYRYDGIKAYTGTAIEYDFTIAESARITVMGELNSAGTANIDVHGVPFTCPYLMPHDNRMWLFGTRIYSTGTVTMAADPTVEGSSTVWTDGMQGMYFQIDGEARIYTIESVTDSDTLELTETFAGTTGAGKSYYIYGEDSILYYSYITTTGVVCPESLPQDVVQHWIPVSKDDGFRGTGLKKVGRNAYVSKENALYLLSGDRPANYRVTRIPLSDGAYHRTMSEDESGNLIYGSRSGVYVSNGNETFSLTKESIQNIFTGEGNPPWYINKARLEYMHGVYDILNKRYLLWVASSSSSKEDKCLVYDFNKIDGQPIGWYWWNIEATCSAIVRDADSKPWVYWGDENGFVYYLNPDATNDAAGMSGAETRRGTATAGASTTLTDSGATFNTTGDGLKACKIKILSGTGIGQERIISSNTGTIITVTASWDTNPDNTSVYAIGYIDAYRKTGWIDFGVLLDKFIRRIKMVFKPQSSTYSAYLKHYADFISTQIGNTQYFNMAEIKGYHSANFAANRAKHHQIEFGICDTDRVIEVRELELEGGVFGTPEETKEAES
ncbi:hypothetical protein LCGC14_0399350 [marine sediment metagenome]|uniref:Uncharacterized protein n=1 Tax=marine sediment metagenome TaxID=412755 RepID=A0A0F9T339_9ZZZZ